ncbi:hypothetical protein PENNAL_c0347G02403, partial [Penicillium nalgiovense]
MHAGHYGVTSSCAYVSGRVVDVHGHRLRFQGIYMATGRRRPRQLDSLSGSFTHMAPQDQQILLRMVGSPHGPSSALHKDVLR